MLPSRHFVFGILFGLILFAIFPQIGLIGFLLIISSTVLIDADHYVYYVIKKKNFSLKNAYKWYVDNGKLYCILPKNKKKNIHFGVCLLHGIEVVFLLFFVFLYTQQKFFLFLITGFVFHQLLDLIDLIKDDIQPHKVLSIIGFLYYTKNKIFIGECKNGR